ncbi:ribonuclease H-like domain-containing protein [Tanacetum coccineum]
MHLIPTHLQERASGKWNMNTGDGSHLNDYVHYLSDILNMCIYPSVAVGDGHFIPVTNSGHSVLSTPFRPLHLNNVLITPNIVKNLISVRQFVHDNSCTVEFDPFGFSVKDFITRWVLLRCDSTGELYPVTKPSTTPHAFLTSQAFNDPIGDNAMTLTRYNALIKNKTWTSVPRPEGANIVRSMWLFRHKFLADGTLSRYKARLVANGSTQVEGVMMIEILVRLLSPVTRDSFGMFLSLHKYAMEILERAHMVGYNSSRTPVDTESKLRDGGTPVVDPTLYRSLVADFAAGCQTTRWSTSGYCVFLGNNLLSWSSKRQLTLSRSSAEAEYRSVANAVAETCWIQNLLRELHTTLSSATIVYCDNVSAVYLSSNPVQHQCTKHIDIDIHFVRDLVATGQVCVLHVPSRFQYADIFTKGLPSALFDEFRDCLSVHCTPAPTAEEC